MTEFGKMEHCNTDQVGKRLPFLKSISIKNYFNASILLLTLDAKIDLN